MFRHSPPVSGTARAPRVQFWAPSRKTGSDFALPPESMKSVQSVVKIFAPLLLCVFALKPFAQSCPDVAPMWPHSGPIVLRRNPHIWKHLRTRVEDQWPLLLEVMSTIKYHMLPPGGTKPVWRQALLGRPAIAGCAPMLPRCTLCAPRYALCPVLPPSPVTRRPSPVTRHPSLGNWTLSPAGNSSKLEHNNDKNKKSELFKCKKDNLNIVFFGFFGII
jgi:hypothetical protein